MAFVESTGWWGGKPQGKRAGNRFVSAGEDPRNRADRIKRERLRREKMEQLLHDNQGFGAGATRAPGSYGADASGTSQGSSGPSFNPPVDYAANQAEKMAGPLGFDELIRGRGEFQTSPYYSEGDTNPILHILGRYLNTPNTPNTPTTPTTPAKKKKPRKKITPGSVSGGGY